MTGFWIRTLRKRWSEGRRTECPEQSLLDDESLQAVCGDDRASIRPDNEVSIFPAYVNPIEVSVYSVLPDSRQVAAVRLAVEEQSRCA